MGGGGGGKGKGSSGADASAAAASKQAASFLKEFQDVSRPVRNTFFQQLEEALTTGGVGARLPIIQRSVEASKSATSAALRGTEEGLARTNLTGTPFGQQILATQRLAGETQTAAIPQQIIQQLLNQVPAAITASQGQIVSGLGQQAASSGQFANQRRAADQQFFASLFSAGSEAAPGIIAASSRDLKEDIVVLNEKDHKSNLEKIENIELVRYQYKDKRRKEPHIGVIAEDAPIELTEDGRRAVNVYDMVSVLTSAVKELSAKLNRFEREKL